MRISDWSSDVCSSDRGSAALAGTTYPIQREITCELLGFDAVGGNSLDNVSDRDFAIEFCAAASIAMMHLSRFSEELVLWTSAQFQFIDLPDRFCTGSSIMPQKRSEEHTSELQSLMRISYAVFCLKKNNTHQH